LRAILGQVVLGEDRGQLAKKLSLRLDLVSAGALRRFRQFRPEPFQLVGIFLGERRRACRGTRSSNS